MRIKGTRFINSGVYQEALERKGQVVISPAEKYAEIPLTQMQRGGLSFVLPHLIYENGLSLDPVSTYADSVGAQIPVLYWDAPYGLIAGLKLPHVNRLNPRLYAMPTDDLQRVLASIPATVMFNPQTSRGCRLGYDRLSLLDFNRKAVGTQTPEDVTVDVYYWTVEFTDYTSTLRHDVMEQAVPKSFKVSQRLANEKRALDTLTTIFEKGKENELVEAINSTALDDKAGDVMQKADDGSVDAKP